MRRMEYFCARKIFKENWVASEWFTFSLLLDFFFDLEQCSAQVWWLRENSISIAFNYFDKKVIYIVYDPVHKFYRSIFLIRIRIFISHENVFRKTGGQLLNRYVQWDNSIKFNSSSQIMILIIIKPLSIPFFRIALAFVHNENVHRNSFNLFRIYFAALGFESCETNSSQNWIEFKPFNLNSWILYLRQPWKSFRVPTNVVNCHAYSVCLSGDLTNANAKTNGIKIYAKRTRFLCRSFTFSQITHYVQVKASVLVCNHRH